ncbi:hypothetical protein DSM112329_00105 [Paraconexibacter sp. AEG42_29]|uniref:Glycosyltransferase 2-like domain-containing protein n=1 Tax=Paraconexibacter sp. AEG42_29 TaxID=2997339 RepID=A0AAU7ANW8_9ACTN
MTRRPSVTVVVPVKDSGHVVRGALDSLAAQDYDGAVNILLVDGGSRDDVAAVARAYSATVLANPAGNEEAGRAVGVAAATGELILLLDADDVLPATDWLGRLGRALDLAPDVVAADCLFHEHRREDPPVVRVCALMGGSDPLAVELGWADRWAWHLDRWTGMPILEEERHGDVLLIRIDPERPPPMGSNGFLVRRDALLQTGYAPSFIHSDCVGDLAALGHRFARVEQGVVHLYAEDLRTYWRKANRRARRSMRGDPVQRRGYRPSLLVTGRQALFSATLVGPAVLAARGYRARPDPAWALYPLLSLLTVAAYVRARLFVVRERLAR